VITSRATMGPGKPSYMRPPTRSGVLGTGAARLILQSIGSAVERSGSPGRGRGRGVRFTGPGRSTTDRLLPLDPAGRCDVAGREAGMSAMTTALAQDQADWLPVGIRPGSLVLGLAPSSLDERKAYVPTGACPRRRANDAVRVSGLTRAPRIRFRQARNGGVTSASEGWSKGPLELDTATMVSRKPWRRANFGPGNACAATRGFGTDKAASRLETAVGEADDKSRRRGTVARRSQPRKTLVPSPVATISGV